MGSEGRAPSKFGKPEDYAYLVPLQLFLPFYVGLIVLFRDAPAFHQPPRPTEKKSF